MGKLKYSTLKEITYTLLQLIPIGKVTTYKLLSEIVGKSPRLIGKFLAENKEIIVIPCHRVVKHSRDIGGYSLGIEFKKKLLEIEGLKIYRVRNKLIVSKRNIIDLKEILELR